MSETKKERYSYPMVARYDKRALAGQLEKERQVVRELKEIKREQKRIIKSLKAADDVQSKRLLWDILDSERDRIEGRPHTATPPPKPSTPTNSKLMDDIQNLFMGGLLKPDKEPAERSPESPEPLASESEPSTASAGLPADELKRKSWRV